MSTRTYVIRALGFGYNDEYFYPIGATIAQVFGDEAAALARYRELELDHARSADLSEQEGLFVDEDAYTRRINDFVLAKTGSALSTEPFRRGLQLPASLSDDDVLELADLIDLHAHRLVVFEGEPVFHAVWNCEEDAFLVERDEYFSALVYSESPERLLAEASGAFAGMVSADFSRRGTLSELSETPELLSRLLEGSTSFTYDPEVRELTAKRPKDKDVVALNGLLRDPIFELRELGVAELQSLEAELAPPEW